MINNSMQDWLQRRIDYWEDVVEKEQQSPEEHAWSEGILQGFYEALEYLQGQRR